MARGVPVACSDLPVLREVGGDVAHYFPPDDPAAAAAAIEAAWADPERARAGPSGPRASPGRPRARHLEAYERALAAAPLMHVGLNLVFLVPGRDRRHGGRTRAS